MAKILSVAEMIAIEKKADSSGLSYDQMMENAGRSIAEHILRFCPEATTYRILILIGPGNNGGDGLVAGHFLAQAGAEVSFYLLKARLAKDPNFERVKSAGARILLMEQDTDYELLHQEIQDVDLLIDGMLGTGFKLPLRGGAQELLKQVGEGLGKKDGRTLIAAIDCPSGVDCDTGEAATECLAADLTITLAAVKRGLLKLPAAELAGELVVGDIGLENIETGLGSINTEMLDPTSARTWLPQRSAHSHKGTFGRLLIVAGSINYPGAAALAALGALRSGVGLVTLAVPEPIYVPLVGVVPEATWLILPDRQGMIAREAAEVVGEMLGRSQALLIGPGFGLDRESQHFLLRLFAGGDEQRRKIGFVGSEGKARIHEIPPLVIDADALKLLAEISAWPTLLPAKSVLTPHPGELAAMSGMTVEQIQQDRIGVARHWAQAWGHVLVLKGAYTVVASPRGHETVIPIATSALAKAGTGDVLAGVIASLIAQGMKPYLAACLGAYLHGQAGRLAASLYGTEVSVLASDVADALPEVFSELRGN